MDRNKHGRPSTLVSRLQDKLRVRSLAREPSPSMRRIWFDDRSKCCRFRRWSSPWILAMRLQWALSVCRSELRDTSLRLRREESTVSRQLGPAPRPPLSRPVRTHLLTPLSMRLSSPGIPAMPPGPRADRISLQCSLVSHSSAARLRPGQNVSRPRLTAPPRGPASRPRRRRVPLPPRAGAAAGRRRCRSARGSGGRAPCFHCAPCRSPAASRRSLTWAQEGAGFRGRTTLRSCRGDVRRALVFFSAHPVIRVSQNHRTS